MSSKLKTYIKERDFEKNKYTQFVIAGDIGATTTRLRVSGVSKADVSEPLYDMEYPSGSFDEFKSRITEAILVTKNKYGVDEIKRGAFGVPGRISRDRQTCTITFLNWGEDTQIVRMLKELGIKKVYIMNDLEAGAHGVKWASKENLIRISEPETSLPQKENFRLILGMPGTGYGCGYRNEEGLTKGMEGGGRAVAISPMNKIEHDLLMHVHQEINRDNSPGEEEKLPSYDYVVSGPGIIRIKDVLLKQEKYANYNRKVANKINDISLEEHPKLIFNLAVDGDKLCEECVEIFCKFFARSMQDMALVTLPEAVFLGGNIVNTIQGFIKRLFQRYFANHVNHKTYLSKLPVYIINNEADLNLKGATNSAITLAR